MKKLELKHIAGYLPYNLPAKLSRQGFMDFQKEELKKEISAFIEENGYTWTVEEILSEYHEKYSKGIYVSHTCKLIIKKFESELKYT